jgi:4-hydroxy-2-oxoheptanedioate aldolase
MLPDPLTAEILAVSDPDYVCVDLQHGFATFSDLWQITQAMRASGVAPLVRVPTPVGSEVMKALDLGAAGVIVPMVDTAELAREMASACRYPSRGHRSWGPTWTGVAPGAADSPAEQDGRVVCIAMIETTEGMANAPAIVATPGIDAIYIGPNDLSLSLGLGRATWEDSSALHDHLDHVIAVCRAAGTPVGLHCTDRAMAAYWIGRGVRMATIGTDTALLMDAARQLLQRDGQPGD